MTDANSKCVIFPLIFANFVTHRKNRYTVCDDQDRVLPTDETKFVQLDTFVVQTGFFL